jgi:hypothetical protein
MSVNEKLSNNYNYVATPEEVANVEAALQALPGDRWNGPITSKNYEIKKPRELITMQGDIFHAVLAETDIDLDQATRQYEHGLNFTLATTKAFYSPEKGMLGGDDGRAFIVPLRGTRKDESFSSDTEPFYPLLSRNNGVSAAVRMRMIYGHHPAMIETYSTSEKSNERGAVVFAPLLEDMIKDINPDKGNLAQKYELQALGAAVILATASFVHEQLGAKVVGLGATIPKMTDYGKLLTAFDPARFENLVTTTGHGGTVWAIGETVKELAIPKAGEKSALINFDGNLGILGGAGSIGWSSTEYMLQHPDFKDVKVHSYDWRKGAVDERLAGYEQEHGARPDVNIKSNEREVLESSTIIVAAVTRPIDLDKIEKETGGQPIDLTGKVIIDDSQPGSFNRQQVEARGGKLAWVVVEDGSDNGFMTRDGLYTGGVPYSYGNEEGLYGPKSEFPCGAEAAVIAKYAAYHDAIREEVTSEKARKIGEWMCQAGIRVAPFQSHSKPVQIL